MPEQEWIKVECQHCEGEGRCPESDWMFHPDSFKYVTCWVCKGHGMLLARPMETKPLDPSESVKP